jgi:hypothetical protein
MESNLKELYVIVLCGCEGIDSLVYATLDKEDAVNAIKTLKNDITKAIEHQNKVFEEFGSEENEQWNTVWDRMYFNKEITNKEHDDACFKDPDAYCIRKWNGIEFSCVCSELGCSPSKPWLM